MSYDIWLSADLGGPESSRVGYLDWNYTSNCAPMWRAAGADLAAFHGKKAGDCLPTLKAAVAAMEADPMRFQEMNPENRWGSYETLLPRLRDLAEAFAEAPLATVEVWR